MRGLVGGLDFAVFLAGVSAHVARAGDRHPEDVDVQTKVIGPYQKALEVRFLQTLAVVLGAHVAARCSWVAVATKFLYLQIAMQRDIQNKKWCGLD